MSALAGTGTLTRLALRRDLPLLLGIAALIAVLLAGVTRSFQDAYPDEAALRGYAAAVGSAPVQHFFNGPGDGLATIGGIVVFEIGGYLVVVVALLSVLAVVRHSRALESAGIAELVRGASLGPQAIGLSAALVAVGSAAVWVPRP